MDQDDFIIWICCSLNFGFVYYESIKRELHIKPTVFVNVGVMKDYRSRVVFSVTCCLL